MDRLSFHHSLDLLLADSAEVEHGSHSLPVPSEPDEALALRIPPHADHCLSDNAAAAFKDVIPVITPGPPCVCTQSSHYNLSPAEVDSSQSQVCPLL